jgi:hypothetical protein
MRGAFVTHEFGDSMLLLPARRRAVESGEGAERLSHPRAAAFSVILLAQMKPPIVLRSTVLLSALIASLGCAHRHEAEPVPAHREHVVGARGDWVRLGERTVDGTHDRDFIAVGAREGRYRRIMIVVEHSALEMFEVVVTFADGSRFSPTTRHIFGADTRSHVIDLPGNARIIRSVEFRYGNLPGGGRAVAELWAE